jgi:hypothetical protein
MLTIDEMSGLPASVIEQMSAVRANGIAEITKMSAGSAYARTRLLWISNPREGKRLKEIKGGGMTALEGLFPNSEDIARVDVAIALSEQDIGHDVYNMRSEHTRAPRCESDCELLLRWAWSRKADEVEFSKKATTLLLDKARELGQRYVSNPPLVQPENVRIKLARIAVALAARTYSTLDGVSVYVKTDHVLSAVEFLDWCYGTESMGYLKHSERLMTRRAQAEANRPKVKQYLANNDGMLVSLQAVKGTTFRPRDFEEWGGGDTDPQTAIKLLDQWRMVRRLEQGRVVLEPTLIEILDELEEEEHG